MSSVNFVLLLSIFIAYVATTDAFGNQNKLGGSVVGSRRYLKLRSDTPETPPAKLFNPLNFALETSTSSPISGSSAKAASIAVAAALLVPTQDAFAKGGEYGILEGRTGSMAHPITMFALFGTSIYSANLGLKYRELRTIGDVSTWLVSSSSLLDVDMSVYACILLLLECDMLI
jgi:hypothetical protein